MTVNISGLRLLIRLLMRSYFSLFTNLNKNKGFQFSWNIPLMNPKGIIVLIIIASETNFNPLSPMSILGSSNSAANKDMTSKIWKKLGIWLSDGVENIVGKEEIAPYEQYLLLPQCFQNLSIVGASKWISVDQRVNTVVRLSIDENNKSYEWKHMMFSTCMHMLFFIFQLQV